jgi:hypothetical protein
VFDNLINASISQLSDVQRLKLRTLIEVRVKEMTIQLKMLTDNNNNDRAPTDSSKLLITELKDKLKRLDLKGQELILNMGYKEGKQTMALMEWQMYQQQVFLNYTDIGSFAASVYQKYPRISKWTSRTGLLVGSVYLLGMFVSTLAALPTSRDLAKAVVSVTSPTLEQKETLDMDFFQLESWKPLQQFITNDFFESIYISQHEGAAALENARKLRGFMKEYHSKVPATEMVGVASRDTMPKMDMNEIKDMVSKIGGVQKFAFEAVVTAFAPGASLAEVNQGLTMINSVLVLFNRDANPLLKSWSSPEERFKMYQFIKEITDMQSKLTYKLLLKTFKFGADDVGQLAWTDWLRKAVRPQREGINENHDDQILYLREFFKDYSTVAPTLNAAHMQSLISVAKPIYGANQAVSMEKIGYILSVCPFQRIRDLAGLATIEAVTGQSQADVISKLKNEGIWTKGSRFDSVFWKRAIDYTNSWVIYLTEKTGMTPERTEISKSAQQKMFFYAAEMFSNLAFHTHVVDVMFEGKLNENDVSYLTTLAESIQANIAKANDSRMGSDVASQVIDEIVLYTNRVQALHAVFGFNAMNNALSKEFEMEEFIKSYFKEDYMRFK